MVCIFDKRIRLYMTSVKVLINLASYLLIPHGTLPELVKYFPGSLSESVP